MNLRMTVFVSIGQSDHPFVSRPLSSWQNCIPLVYLLHSPLDILLRQKYGNWGLRDSGEGAILFFRENPGTDSIGKEARGESIWFETQLADVHFDTWCERVERLGGKLEALRDP